MSLKEAVRKLAIRRKKFNTTDLLTHIQKTWGGIPSSASISQAFRGLRDDGFDFEVKRPGRAGGDSFYTVLKKA